MKRMIQTITLVALTTVSMGGCVPPASEVELPDEDTLVIFHNDTGPMCLEALDWLAAEHPDLPVEEYLTTDPANLAILEQWKDAYGESRGVSSTFSLLPIIFFGGEAFSGFDQDVQQSLAALIDTMEVASP